MSKSTQGLFGNTIDASSLAENLNDLEEKFSRKFGPSDINPLSIKDLHDPFLLKDLECACEIITSKIFEKSRIMVFGDFDADGITASVILVHALRCFGGEVSYRLPDRLREGHGIMLRHIDEALDNNCRFGISVDCGINDHAAVEYAFQKGMSMIITDHHNPDQNRHPNKALAVINPHQHACNYPCKHLSGSGVVLKLVQGLYHYFFQHYAERLPEKFRENFPSEEDFLAPYFEMATIGTIADCMSLVEENLAIIHRGITYLQKTSWKGIQKIIDTKNITYIDEDVIGFVIAPLINSASRMGNVLQASQLFLGGEEIFQDCLSCLEVKNAQRKKITLKQYEKIRENFSPDESFYLDFNESYHFGINGLVAGKIAEEFNVPVFIGSLRPDGLVSFSARSPVGFSLINLLHQSQAFFESFGGHQLAGGMVVQKEKIPDILKNFREFFTAHPLEIKKKVLSPIAIPTALLQQDILKIFAKFSPFGVGRDRPIFLLPLLLCMSIKALGKSQNTPHRKIIFSDQEKTVEILAFFFTEKSGEICIGQSYRPVVSLHAQHWKGEVQLQVKLVEILKA